MKALASRIVVAVAVMAGIAATAPVASAADTTPVTNDAFSLTLPVGFGEFATQTQKSKASDGGVIATTNWVSKSPTGEAVVVTVSRMPAKILDPEKLMSSTRDTLLASLKATLESEQKVAGDMPTVELLFKGQTENPPYLRSRLAVQEDRFFQLLYVGRNQQQRDLPSVADLFDSFRISAPATQNASASGNE